jgi:hypothetical protein
MDSESKPTNKSGQSLTHYSKINRNTSSGLSAEMQVSSACVYESYIGIKLIGTRVVPQFTTEVKKPLTQ